MSAMHIDTALDDFSTLLGQLTSASVFSKRDIETLRDALLRQGGINRRRAAEIFHANRIMLAKRDDDWSEFYLETLAGFFLQYQNGRQILPAESEDLLLAWLGAGVSIDHYNERRLTLRILLMATEIPDRIEQRVLEAVSNNLISQSGRWLGIGQRSAGVVDALDMQLIRRLIHRTESQCPRNCSRAAFTFLLNLNQQMDRFADPEGWRQLLLNCLARHLFIELRKNVHGLAEQNDRFEAWVKRLSDDGCSIQGITCLRDDIFSVMQRDSGLCDKLSAADDSNSRFD